MYHKGIAVALAAICLVALGSQRASALGPMGAIRAPAEAQIPRVYVTFWAQPFPYGYTGWGPCIRYERFDTEWGPRFRRVSICGSSYGRHYRVLHARG